jgi:hypothetical protein
MTAPFSLPIVYGTVSGSPIAGFVNAGTWQLVYVTLSANYARNPPGGYPVPPYPGPVTASLTATAQTIASGTRLELFADEAAALVAASAAADS